MWRGKLWCRGNDYHQGVPLPCRGFTCTNACQFNGSRYIHVNSRINDFLLEQTFILLNSVLLLLWLIHLYDYSVTFAPFSSVLIMWLCIPAGEPGLGFVPAEADGVGVEPHDVGRHTHTGGPAPETAPPGGRGEAQVPQPGRAAHPAAAVSPDLHWFIQQAHNIQGDLFSLHCRSSHKLKWNLLS